MLIILLIIPLSEKLYVERFFSVKIRQYNECNDILIVMNIFEHFTQAITVGNYPKKIT